MGSSAESTQSSVGLVIVVYAVVAVIVGAALAPWLWYVGQYLIQSGWVPQLAGYGFGKYLNRSILLMFLCGLWPLINHLKLASFNELGLHKNPHKVRHLILGLSVGFVVLIVCGCIGTAMDYREFHGRMPAIGALGAALLAALVVSPLEEGLFRGLLLKVMSRRFSIRVAMWSQALVFGVIHFLRPDAAYRHYRGEVGTWTGFELVPLIFTNLGDPAKLIGGLTTLCLVGYTLADLRLRTRSLWLPIGLHAGWILGLKMIRLFTDKESAPDLFYQITRIPGGVVAIAAVLVSWYVLRSSIRSMTNEERFQQ